MISRKAFCKLIESFKIFCNGVNEVEKLFNFVCEDNFMGKHLDSMLNALTDLFFSDDELDQINKQSITIKHISSKDVFIHNSIENVFNFIFDFCITRNFGENDNENILVIQVNGETIESYNCSTPDELYTIICRYLDRSCDETSDTTYYINCMCLR